MSSTKVIELTSLPLERVESEVAVAGFFSDERPLRGGVARADWRLCGGLSKRVERGDLEGLRGEALLIGCGRALRAPRLLVVGLGDRRDFDLVRLSDEMKGVLARCAALRCENIVLSPLGVAADDVPRHASAMVAGIRDSCLDAELHIRIHLCIRASEITGVHRALEAACKAASADDIEVRLSARDRKAAVRTPAPRPQSPASPG